MSAARNTSLITPTKRLPEGASVVCDAAVERGLDVHDDLFSFRGSFLDVVMGLRQLRMIAVSRNYEDLVQEVDRDVDTAGLSFLTLGGRADQRWHQGSALATAGGPNVTSCKLRLADPPGSAVWQLARRYLSMTRLALTDSRLLQGSSRFPGPALFGRTYTSSPEVLRDRLIAY